MGWNAYLVYDDAPDDFDPWDDAQTVGDWSGTHNINAMVALAVETAGLGETAQATGSLGPVIGPAWFDHLDGRTGPEGGAFLHAVIGALDADPPRFEALNPANGFGSYADLVPLLRSMRDAVPERPCHWKAHG